MMTNMQKHIQPFVNNKPSLAEGKQFPSLPFIEIIIRQTLVPNENHENFKHVLKQTNRTHKHHFNIDGLSHEIADCLRESRPSTETSTYSAPT